MPKRTHRKNYTVSEAAAELGITRSAVHEAIKTGRLKAKKGKVRQVQIIEKTGWLIPAKAVHDYQVSLSHQQRGKKA